MKFKDIFWPQAIYIKSLLKNRKIIPYNMAAGRNYFPKETLMKHLMNYNLKKYDINHNCVICKNLAEDEVKNQIHLIDAESTKRKNIAKFLLETIVNEILYEFKESDINKSYKTIEDTIKDFEQKSLN